MKIQQYLTIFVLSFSLTMINFVSVEADWKDKYNQQINSIDSQINSVQAQLRSISETIGEIDDKKYSLENEIALMQEEIRQLNRLITQTKRMIAETELNISIKEDKIAKIQNEMVEIVQEYQRQRDRGLVQYIFSSESLSGFITKFHDMSNVGNNLNRLKATVDAEKQNLQTELKNLEETRFTLEQAEFLVQSKQDSVKLLLIQVEEEKKIQEGLKDELQDIQGGLQKDLAKVEYEIAKKQAEINACLKNTDNYYDIEKDQCLRKPTVNNNSSYTGGTTSGCVNEATNMSGLMGISWIEPARGYITQAFDCVPYLNGAHDGVDIANALNTPIYAVADGVVTQSGWRGGYGYAVLIKHEINDRRLYTRYAHLNTLPPVNIGQSVGQGQIIGYMGTTGFSTGVHLHFSISDESLESTGNSNCNPRYGYTSTFCYNPFQPPFNLYK